MEVYDMSFFDQFYNNGNVSSNGTVSGNTNASNMGNMGVSNTGNTNVSNTNNTTVSNANNTTNTNVSNNSTMTMPAQTNKNCPTSMPMTAFPQETPIGMAYVPYQMWEKPYDDVVAFSRGTIFPSLDKPFIGEEAVKNARQR